MELSICYLYPDALNLYGDRGNIICMRKRLAWRGIDCRVTELPIGEKASLAEHDIFFMGGGQDFEQEILLDDLFRNKAAEIKAAISDGKTFLCVCGGYQMLGHYYLTHTGAKLEFLGAVDLYTEGATERMIGNYTFAIDTPWGESTVVGFENHSGRTWLGEGVAPLGKVLKGYGNNGRDGCEGLHYKNVFGTYCHGPALPKNPAFCDTILQSAIDRKYPGETLSPLENKFENTAHQAMMEKLLKRK